MPTERHSAVDDAHHPRVTVRLMGGLGNQLFQLAHAVNLAQLDDAAVDLDLCWFERPSRVMTPRALEMPLEALPLPVVSVPRWVWHRGLGAWTGEGHAGRLAPLAARMNRRFEMGYWQSSASVASARASLEALIRSVESSRGRIEAASDCVAVHVRRGDYVSDIRTMRFHGPIDVDTQLTLAKRLADERGIERVRVFSDAPEDLRNVIAGIPGVEMDDSTDAWDALLRMSCARVLIACNSSLSWWAGVYGGWRSEEGIDVYVPTPWLAEPSELDRALPLTGWTAYRRPVSR